MSSGHRRLGQPQKCIGCTFWARIGQTTCGRVACVKLAGVLPADPAAATADDLLEKRLRDLLQDTALWISVGAKPLMDFAREAARVGADERDRARMAVRNPSSTTVMSDPGVMLRISREQASRIVDALEHYRDATEKLIVKNTKKKIPVDNLIERVKYLDEMAKTLARLLNGAG